MDTPETPLNRREYLAIAVATASVAAYTLVSESSDSGLSALGGEPGTYGVDGYGTGGYGEGE